MMVQAFDNDRKVAYCTPAKPRFVGFEAAHQSIHEPKDAYPDNRDFADLPQPGVLLFLIWQESFATRLGLNPPMTL